MSKRLLSFINNYEIISSSKWNKSHLRFKDICQTSLCRFVSAEPEKMIRRTGFNFKDPDSMPSCKTCVKLVSSFISLLRKEEE